jgi:hypothetical protein
MFWLCLSMLLRRKEGGDSNNEIQESLETTKHWCLSQILAQMPSGINRKVVPKKKTKISPRKHRLGNVACSMAMPRHSARLHKHSAVSGACSLNGCVGAAHTAMVFGGRHVSSRLVNIWFLLRTWAGAVLILKFFHGTDRRFLVSGNLFLSHCAGSAMHHLVTRIKGGGNAEEAAADDRNGHINLYSM